MDGGEDELPELAMLPRVVNASAYEARVAQEVDIALTREQAELEDARLARAQQDLEDAEHALAAVQRTRSAPARVTRARARVEAARAERDAVAERIALLQAEGGQPRPAHDHQERNSAQATAVVETTSTVYSSAAEAQADAKVPIAEGVVVPARLHGRLLPYQREGVQWLVEHHARRTGGGILADEMGLGKTVQTVACLAALHASGMLSERPNALVVAPATVLRQWRDEILRWYPAIQPHILHPSADKPHRERPAPTVWITTYEQLGTKGTGERILRTPFAVAVLDEGHRVRNADTRAARLVRRIDAHTRFVLSGTPVQNELGELWALIDWVAPGRLGTLPVFRAELAAPIAAGGFVHASSLQVQTAYRCAVHLRALIAPHILRRLKADVLGGSGGTGGGAGALPAKTEQVLFCRLTPYQRRAYRVYLASPDVRSILAGDRNVLAGIDVLRKICNHPDLLFVRSRSRREDDDETLLDTSPETLEAIGASVLPSGALPAERLPPKVAERSCKLAVLLQLLERWSCDGHRALVFCQTRQMLDIVEDALRSSGLPPHLRMDGATPVGARKALVDSFNADDSPYSAFLLTTRVGGLGLNLTGADRVVLFDPDWNPSTDAQARERAWRLGQTRPVAVYRLLTAGTIEERIYHRQVFKTLLTSRVLDDPAQSARFLRSTDLYDLFTLDAEDAARDTGADMGLDTEGLVHRMAAGPDTEPTRQAHVLDDVLGVAGLEHALEHDKMMQRPRHELALVSREAQRRADAALAVLRGSAAVSRTMGTGDRQAASPSVPRGTALLGITGGASSQRVVALSSSSGRQANAADSFDSEGVVRRLIALFRSSGGASRVTARPVSSAAIAQAFPDMTGSDAVAFRRVLRTVALRSPSSGLWMLRSEYRRYL